MIFSLVRDSRRGSSVRCLGGSQNRDWPQKVMVVSWIWLLIGCFRQPKDRQEEEIQQDLKVSQRRGERQ